jgi:hypothetical protein
VVGPTPMTAGAVGVIMVVSTVGATGIPPGVAIKAVSFARHTAASMSADIAAIGPDTVDHAYCGLSRSSSEQGDSGGEEIAQVVPAPHFALDPRGALEAAYT